MISLKFEADYLDLSRYFNHIECWYAIPSGHPNDRAPGPGWMNSQTCDQIIFNYSNPNSNLTLNIYLLNHRRIYAEAQSNDIISSLMYAADSKHCKFLLVAMGKLTEDRLRRNISRTASANIFNSNILKPSNCFYHHEKIEKLWDSF